MTTSRQHRERSERALTVANSSVLRPPLVVLAALLLGAVLTVVWPLPFFLRILGPPVGGLLIAIAAALFSYSVRQFWVAGTPVPGNKPTTVIVRTGPYRFSRNPIYLAFFLLHLGLAIWVNSLWLIATLIPTVALMTVVVVPREERYLTGRFGVEYSDYKASVRRWL